jgi:hypothetical protein
MSNIPTPPPPVAIDNPHAPDVFADAATGWFLSGGNVRITFESVRANHMHQAPLNRVVIGRLVMPMDAAEAMAKQLLDFIAHQRQLQNATAQAPSETLQ